MRNQHELIRWTMVLGATVAALAAAAAQPPAAEPAPQPTVTPRGPASQGAHHGKAAPPAGSNSENPSHVGAGLKAKLPSHGAPTQVHFGIFLKNVEDIDVKTNTYYLDFIMWFRWRGGHVDPTKGFRFVNVLDTWGITIRPAYEEPITLKDGSKYLRYSVEGKFYSKFHLDHFPLDTHQVTLGVEDVFQDDELVYLPDVEASQISSDLRIPGWSMEGFDLLERRVTYNSNFGQIGLEVPRTFSRVEFKLHIRRPHAYWYAKMLPPVLIVLLCSFLIFFLSAEYVDARVGTVVTALLTSVFLQLTFTANLPAIGVLFHLDKIFNFSYLIMFLMLVECIVVTRMYDRASAMEQQATEAESDEERRSLDSHAKAIHSSIRKIDRIALVGFPATYIIGCVLLTVLL